MMITGTCAFLRLGSTDYTRAQVAAAYDKAIRAEPLTREEANLVGAWCVHPLNGPVGLAYHVIGSLLMVRWAKRLPADGPLEGHDEEPDDGNGLSTPLPPNRLEKT